MGNTAHVILSADYAIEAKPGRTVDRILRDKPLPPPEVGPESRRPIRFPCLRCLAQTSSL